MVHARFGTASTLIGREAELALLGDHLSHAFDGRGSVVLVSGEAGIGKSRLISESRAEFSAREADGVVLEGRCFEPDRTLPYAPFIDLLRKDLAPQSSKEIERWLGQGLPDVLRLLPELGSRFPDIASTSLIDATQERRRVFQAIADYIERRATPGPALVVLEDLHWSDLASLDLVPYLARHVQQMPVVMVCTYRSDEVGDDLRHMLATLDRERLAFETHLTGLSLSELDLMLRSIFEQEATVRSDFLRAIHDLTNGNPFFVEEVVRSLVISGDIFRYRGKWTRKELADLRIPRSIQDAVLGRCSVLTEQARAVLDLAAAIGQRFDFDLLLSLTQEDEQRLLALIRELIDAGLVDEESADSYRFHHALAREAIYGQMLARERRSLHRQVGKTIEDFAAGMLEPYLSDLAYHFYHAEQWAKAREYARLAGERALSLFAPQAATEHFTHAIEAATQMGVEPEAQMLRLRGIAFETLGDFEDARRDFEASLTIARQTGDRQAEWQALVDLGRSWEGLDYERAGEFFEQALAVARDIGSAELLAHSLNRVGTWYTNTERTEEARSAHLDALEIFQDVEDLPGMAATYDYLGTVCDLIGDLAGMRANLEQAARIFEDLGDEQRLASTLATMSCLGGICVFDTVGIPERTTFAEAEGWGKKAVALARKTSWRAGESYAIVTISYLYQMHGHLAKALAHATSGLEIAEEIEHAEWRAASHVVLGGVFQTLHDHDAAIKHLDQATAAARESGSAFFEMNALALLAISHAATGDVQRARQILDGFGTRLPMNTLGQRAVWKAKAALALKEGRAEQSLEILERLAATAPNAVGLEDLPVLAILASRALVALGLTGEGEMMLRAAQRSAAQRGLRPALCDAHVELALLYSQCSRQEESEAELAVAAGIAEEMARGLDDDIRRAYLARFQDCQQESLLPNGGHDGTLTRREWEVALLVAEGLSNRQIGGRLFIGERTVETHVSNALAKLGFKSRAQIAAWVSAGGMPDGGERSRLPPALS